MEMKVKHTLRAALMTSALLISCSAMADSAIENCDSDDNNFDQMACLSRNLDKLDKELNATYQAALAAMPKTSDDDNRKEQQQLRKSQRAWLKYKDENCALVGGLEGGNNRWVGKFSAMCEVDAVTDRIKFLKTISKP
jgi:uncharacterized protein YecT (DUF1311 family)